MSKVNRGWEEQIDNLFIFSDFMGVNWDYNGGHPDVIKKIIRQEISQTRNDLLREIMEEMPKKKHITKWKRHPQAEDGDKWCCYDGCEACARTQGGEFGFNDYHDQVNTLLESKLSTVKK